MNSVYGVKRWTLLQDGASPQTSKMTMDYLKNKCIVLENWPAISPDLNVIENLWSIPKKRVEELQPKFINDLIDVIFDVWNSLEQALIRNLVDSMPNRLNEVIKRLGEPNGY